MEYLDDVMRPFALRMPRMKGYVENCGNNYWYLSKFMMVNY